VFLTDMGDEAARIGFKVWADGTVYYLTRLKLVPHETRVVVRKLRDAQQADLKGNKIPAAATDGSANWIRLDKRTGDGPRCRHHPARRCGEQLRLL